LANIPSSYGYVWKIYLQCQVGGNFVQNDLDSGNYESGEHANGNFYEFDFFLTNQTGSIRLPNRKYSWIKCNRNFNGYYLTSYSDYNFKVLGYLLKDSSNHNVIKFYFEQRKIAKLNLYNYFTF
jgi:hypothetical protein